MGTAGRSVSLATEPPGVNCEAGGLRVNGFDLVGMPLTAYVCSPGAPRFADGGFAVGAIPFALADGGLGIDPRLSFDAPGGAVRLNSDLLWAAVGGTRTIGIPPVNFGSTNLVVRAGGMVSSSGSGSAGGVLELRAGNANQSGGFGCAGAGPQGNSVKIYAGDNVFAGTCFDVNNGDIEFYAGHLQPERMRIVGDTGNVGIGTNAPTQRLHVIGNILASAVVTPSDARLKEEVRTIERARELLQRLNGVHYRWKKGAQAKYGTRDGEDVGLLAQDVQQVLPEAVVTLPDGTLTVNYAKVMPLVVEAFKAQEVRLEQLEARLNKLERR
jgi:hypothetical protein